MLVPVYAVGHSDTWQLLVFAGPDAVESHVRHVLDQVKSLAVVLVVVGFALLGRLAQLR